LASTDLAAIRSRWRGLPFVHVCATALSLTPLDLVVWGKASAGAGNLYRAQHELLPLFKSEINNDPRLPLVARNGRRRTTVECPLLREELTSNIR
jgi:hypothetical protein